jgi:hypothetical protein
MRRMFWLALGVTVGVLAMRKLSKVAQKMTPTGIAGTLGRALGDLAEAVRDFAVDVRARMDEHEAALRAGSGIDGSLGAKPEDMS